MDFANYTNFEKKRHVVSMKTTRRFVENDTLFYRKRHVVFLCLQEVFLENTFSCFLVLICKWPKDVLLQKHWLCDKKIVISQNSIYSPLSCREYLFNSAESSDSSAQRTSLQYRRE